MTIRLISLLFNGNATPKTKHYVGFPPVLAEGEDYKARAERCLVLGYRGNSRRDIPLPLRRTRDTCVGDTWHMNVDDAKHQATCEYGDSVHEWTSIPSDVRDVVVFGIKQMKPGE